MFCCNHINNLRSFSRADLLKLVQEATLEAIQRVQQAQFFKKVPSNPKGKPVFMPCDPEAEGAEKIQLTELEPDQIQKQTIMLVNLFAITQN